MILQENHIPDIKTQLSKRYYFGDKWVGYKNDKEVLSARDLFCFRDLNKQYLFQNNQWCRYQPIPTVLKSLDQEKQVGEESLDEKRLLVLVQQYPIVAFHTGMDLTANLAKGDLFPVMYGKTIEPEKEIYQYHVIQHNDAIDLFQEPSSVSFLQSFHKYKEAEDCLRHQVSQCAEYDQWEKPHFRIVGDRRVERAKAGVGLQGNSDAKFWAIDNGSCTGSVWSIQYYICSKAGQPCYRTSDVGQIQRAVG